MEKQFSEQEIANRIIALHDNSRLGFRRITHDLSNDGIRISKDKAWRIYKKHIATKESSPMGDKELSELRRKQEATRKRLQLFKEKNAIRRDIALLTVQRVMEDFEARRMLFNGESMLFKFAKKALPLADPMVWNSFLSYCSEQEFVPSHALLIAAGQQEDFEAQCKDDEKLTLDKYLCLRLRNRLDAWKRCEEESEEPAEEEQREKTDEYIDDQGFLNIQVPVSKPPS